jgi:predicted RNA-binding protein with PUA domain
LVDAGRKIFEYECFANANFVRTNGSKVRLWAKERSAAVKLNAETVSRTGEVHDDKGVASAGDHIDTVNKVVVAERTATTF